MWKSALVCLSGKWIEDSVGEPSFDFIVVHDFLTEGVGARLGALVHLDAHGVLLSASLLERCDCLLSHGSWVFGLFDFLVDRHLAKDRVVFLQLDSVGGVLAVFRRHVTGRARSARSLMFGALEDDLYAVAFLRHDPENGGQRYAFPPPIPLVNKHVAKSALEWGVPLLSI